jgi:adenylate cyclase
VSHDLSRFEELSLFDPTASDHAERRALIEWFLDRGVSDDDIVSTLSADDFPALYESFVGWSQNAVSARQVAERTGLDLSVVLATAVAAGLGLPEPDESRFVENDLAAFELLRVAHDVFSAPELLAFIRVVGSSMSRVAEAANTLFRDDIERPLLESGASASDLLRRNIQAQDLAGGLSAVLSMMLRQHLAASIERSRLAGSLASTDDPMSPLVIGFVDLVGFTSRSGAMSMSELSTLVGRFEALATDTVSTLGGRLVKFIGDEMMFVAIDPEQGCRIGRAILQEFGSDPALTPRGGMAYGPVLAKLGDYFGSVVNLASRLVDQAVPGEILVTAELAERSGFDLEPAGRRMLKGFADPVAVASLTKE